MLLNLQRVVIALVNNMAIAENIAYQTIYPCVAAGHFGQQRLNNSQTLRDVFSKGFANCPHNAQFTPCCGLNHHGDEAPSDRGYQAAASTHQSGNNAPVPVPVNLQVNARRIGAGR